MVSSCDTKPSIQTTVNADSTNAAHDTFYLCDQLVHIEPSSAFEFGVCDTSMRFNENLEQNKLVKDSSIAKRISDTLFLSLIDKTLHFIDDSSDNATTFVKYLYFGRNQSLGQLELYAGLYEGSLYVLLDTETGDTTYTIGPPVISPDKSKFICANSDMEAGYDFNGLEVYSNTHPPKLLCRRELTDWGPQEIKWVSEKEMLVRAYFINSSNNKDSFLKLELQ